MYGRDCQVLSNMGGNVVVPPDSLFSSPIHNPSFNFMAGSMNFHPFPPVISSKEENGLMMMKGKEEMMDSGGSGSDHLEGLSLSGNEQDNVDIDQQQQLPKKKRYHRHTARQIQEMEAVFKECPHPDDKQRTRLSQELGLKPRQVKFWFQNRRTQMKAQQDRADNAVLRNENENLRNENYRLQAALRNIVCPSCGGAAIIGEISFDEQQLRIDNARLKEELERVCSIASRYSGRPVQTMIRPPPLLPPSLELEMGMYPRHDFQDPMGNCSDHMTMPMPPMLPENNPHFPEGIMILDEEKQLALELAVSSIDELMKMCRIGEPLWIETKENGKGVLNLEEYARMFPWSITNRKQNPNEFKTEATRESAVVIMNSITLVDALLDANKWMELFPSIVSRARTVQVITSGISGHANGSLQLMSAALQFLSPLVPTREAYFLRYCHQNVEEGIWAVVDFPINKLHNSNANAPFSLYKRRPSGCIIQDMPNGYSRVTWVEHAELDDKPIHQIFNPIISSGMAFGAKRWSAVLQRQCERITSLMARNIPDLGVIPSMEARKNLMNLSQRMIRTFCSSIGDNPGGQSWTALSESYDDTVRITTRRISGPGQPNGVILAAVSTIMLPHPHFRVFDLLRDERRRYQLGVLANGSFLHEIAHIANGSHHGNCISLLRINVPSNSSQNVELLLQESCIDESGCLVVFATIDVDSIQLVMNGEDPSCISLLLMGFVISLVDQPNIVREDESEPNNKSSNSASSSTTTSGGSCLLTVGVQMLASTLPTAKLSLTSVTAINNHINDMVNQISMALVTTTITIIHENATTIIYENATTIIHENATEDLDLQQQQQPCAADKPSAE